MMAKVENLVLEHLRHIRGQLDRMEHPLQEVAARSSHFGRAVADRSPQITQVNAKLGRLDARVTRIENRLDLVER